MSATYLRDTAAPSPARPEAGASARRSAATLQGPIMVATDGTEASAPAIAVARIFSRALNAPVQLVSVIEPTHMLLPSAEGLPFPSIEDRRAAEDRLQIVREQQRVAGGGEGWTTEVKFGDPATVLTRMAKARRARVLVTGRRRHGRVDRLLGDDTVFDVIRLAETPVLIATEPVTVLPKVLTVAVDFSDLSTQAARTALRLSPSAAMTFLVHVRPEGGLGDLTAKYAHSVTEGFDRMVEELDAYTGARIDTVELSGVPAREIVAFAESSRTELLVVGSYRRGLFRRLAGGTMALRMVHAAPCPVLIVPEAATEDVMEGDVEEQAVSGLPDGAINAMLDELTRRNAGRRALFESDSPRVGAQLLAFDYLFLAARFDIASEKVRIAMTDDSTRSCQSITHSIAKPTDMDIRRAVDGSDHVVRLINSCGQATLTFW